MYPTKHYSEFSNVLTAFHRKSKSLCGGTELAVKENKENSPPVGSCRRVGLRRVGLGKSREPPKNQQEFCQTREGIHGKQDGYRPPMVPSYMAGTLSGDVSNFSFITFTFDGLCRVQRKSFLQLAITLALTSPDVISSSPKIFLTSRIDFTVLLLIEFLKKHHLPVGQVKNRIH